MRSQRTKRIFHFGLTAIFWVSIAVIPFLIVAWGISWRRWDVLHVIFRSDVCFSVGSCEGQISYEATVVERHISGAGMPLPPPPPWVEFHHTFGSPPMNAATLLSPAKIPYWSLMILSAAAAIGIKIWKHRKSANAVNVCTQCNYDLRAHHPGDKCPECGTLIPPAETATIAGKPRSPS